MLKQKYKYIVLPTSASIFALFKSETSLLMESFVPFYSSKENKTYQIIKHKSRKNNSVHQNKKKFQYIKKKKKTYKKKCYLKHEREEEVG